MIALNLTEKIDKAIRSVSALRKILEFSKNMIECYSLPAGEILKRINPSLFLDCGYFKKTPPEDFFMFITNTDVSDAEAYEIMRNFAKDFGKSYRQDELSRCSLYLERMRSREQKLAKESAKKKKVIFTVALCSALALIILII
jgi:hypothetical protein